MFAISLKENIWNIIENKPFKDISVISIKLKISLLHIKQGIILYNRLEW